jgi:hypothetical protein
MKQLIIYDTRDGSILDIIIKPLESAIICEGTGTMLNGILTSDALIGVDETKIIQLFIESSERAKHGYSRLKRVSANSIDTGHTTFHRKKVTTTEQVEIAKGIEINGPTMPDWPNIPGWPKIPPIQTHHKIDPIVATKTIISYEPESIDVTIKGVGLDPPTAFTEADVKIHSDETAERVGHVDVGAIKIETDIHIHPNTHKVDIVNKKIIKKDDGIKYED